MTTQHDELRDLVTALEAEAATLTLTRFTEDDAWAVGSWLWETARERDLSISVSIRRGEHRLFHASRPGTSADNDSWIERKERVVRRYEAASYLVGRRLAADGKTLEDVGLDPLLHAAHGGCVPVVVAGAGMVATVTVSGLRQGDDHALVVEALRVLQDASPA